MPGMALPRVVVQLVAAGAAPGGSDAAGPGGDGPAGAQPGGPVLRVLLEDVGMMDVVAEPLGAATVPLGAGSAVGAGPGTPPAPAPTSSR